MVNELNVQISMDIDAPPSKVWETLMDPSAAKEYMMGAEVETDWKVGSPITWKGEWDGTPYEDTGKVLAIEPEKMLQYDHFSNAMGEEDTSENHRTVTVEISPNGEGTHLELTQSNAGTEKEKAEMEKNWQMMFGKFKEIAER